MKEKICFEIATIVSPKLLMQYLSEAWWIALPEADTRNAPHCM